MLRIESSTNKINLTARLKTAICLCILASIIGLTTGPAATAQASGVVKDCLDGDGKLGGDYSPSQLNSALNNLPSDIDEYSDCRDQINSALLRSAGKKPNKKPRETLPVLYDGKGKGSVVASGSDTKALTKSKQRGDQPLEIDGEQVTPGVSSFSPAALANDLPKPLSGLLLAVSLISLLAVGAATTRRIRERRASSHS